MQNGDIDGTFDLAISDIDQWKALNNVDVITAPSLGIFVLTLDHSAPPFDDIHVRRAIAYAVDREGLVKALLKGNGEPATALNPPEMWAGVLPPEEVRAFYATLPATVRSRKGQGRAGAIRRIRTASTSPCPAPPAIPTWSTSCRASGEPEADRHHVDVQEIDGNQWLAGYFRHEKLGMQIMAYYPDSPIRRTIPTCSSTAPMPAKDGMNGSNFKNPEVDAASPPPTRRRIRRSEPRR